MDNYYDKTLSIIKSLISKNNYQNAFEKINEELAMPYIPKQVEKELNSLLKEVLVIKNDELFKHKTIGLTLQNIEQLLLDSNKEDEILIGIAYLKIYNIRQILPAIKKYLGNASNHNISKMQLLFLLKEQQVNEVIVVKKTNGIFNINPTLMIVLHENINFVTIQKLLDKNVYNDNPSLYNICLYMLEMYYYSMYPFFVDNNEVNALTGAIIYQANLLQNNHQDLNKITFDFDCDRSLIKKYLDIFQDMEDLRTS